MMLVIFGSFAHLLKTSGPRITPTIWCINVFVATKNQWKSIISSLIGPATEIVGKFVQDKDKAAQLAHDISTMADRHAQEAMLAQLEVNKAEAQGNWFQASWRPLCGYVCVLGLMVNFLISPICAGIWVRNSTS